MSKKKKRREQTQPASASASTSSSAAAHASSITPAIPWRQVRVLILLAALYFLLVCLSTPSVIKGTAMVMMILAILVGCIRGKVLQKQVTWLSFFLLLWVLMEGISTLYAVSGKFALQEFLKVLVSFCLVILILAFEKGNAKELGRRTATLVECFAALVSLISIDFISTRTLSSIFFGLMGIFSQDYSGMTGIEAGVRMTSILENPNVFAGCVGIGVLLSLGLVNSSTNSYERRFHTACLALSSLGFLLAFSMGASGVIVAAFLVYLFLESGKKRSSLLVLMVETLICALAAAFPIYLTSFDAWVGMQPVPLLAAVCAAVFLCLLDHFVGQKVSLWLSDRPKAAPILLAGVLAVCGVYAVLAFNVTGGTALAAGESLRRSAYPEPGSYTLTIQADQELQVTIESQNQQDTMMHTSTVIYSGNANNAEFVVPDDSIVVYFNFLAAQDTNFESASIQGNSGSENLKLGYKLLPGFIANRMQGLFANQNAIQRTVFFEDGLKLFQRSPIIGLGIGAVESSIFSVQTFNYETRYVHNHYIQTLAETGIIGLIFFVGVLLTSIIAVWKKRKSGEESPLNNTLGAIVIFMAGHAAVEVVFSSEFYLPLAFSIFALVNLCSADTLPLFQSKHNIRRWIPRVTSGLLAVYAVLLTGNLCANKLAENPYYESLDQAILFDRFEWADYMLSYVYSASADENRTSTITDHMERYMEKLETLNSNSVPYYLAESYFNLGNTEKAFEMLDKYLNYVASDQDAWNQAFQMMILHSEDTPEFKNGVIRIYEKLVQWNEENMGSIQLTSTATALVETILSEQS